MLTNAPKSFFLILKQMLIFHKEKMVEYEVDYEVSVK